MQPSPNDSSAANANVDIVVVTPPLEPDRAESGSGYTSLKNQNEDNDNGGLSPNAARGSAWASLERRGSDLSAQDFELEPINDRTGLTSVSRSRPSLQEEEDILTGGDASNSIHPQPSPRRRGFHNNPSLISGSSSSQAKSNRSTAPGTKLSSMKLALGALGRASTRVMNLSGSSQSQPPVLEVASMYSRRSTDVTEDQDNGQRQQHITASTGHLEEPSRTSNASRISNASRTSAASRTSIPRMAEAEPIAYGLPPLQGKSLFILGPDNPLRNTINSFLNQTWVELFLLLLIITNLVFLILKNSSPLGNDTIFGSHWTDYGIMVIFILYTLEIIGRIIVCGLVLYPEDGDKIRRFFGRKPKSYELHETNPTILRRTPEGLQRLSTMQPASTFINRDPSNPMRNTMAGERAPTLFDYAFGRRTTQYLPQYLDPIIAYTPQFVVEKAPIPFLRHTFNRLDLLAVVCYWVDVILMFTGVQNIYFFKAMAAMRTLRLLNITPGSSTILQSLKKSAPLLVNIVYFIAFFFIIFSIIGVQAFKGSFSRRCVSVSNSSLILESQYCGGYINATDGAEVSYITSSGIQSRTSPKGNICPVSFQCKDIGASFDGVVSFDTIYNAMVPVYVLMAGQTWTDLMYKMMDAEYKWSSLYFVVVVVIMNFWILNLFIAVINEMFAKIRDDSENNSAFKSESKEKAGKVEKSEKSIESEDMEEKDEPGREPDLLEASVNNFGYKHNNPDNPDDPDGRLSRKKGWIERFEFVWVVAVIADLTIQCLPQYDTPTEKVHIYENIEFWFTVAFAFDIISRFLFWLPTPKEFVKSKKNLVDLFLAVITMIIYIPPIRQSSIYVYLTVFLVLRIYRPIIYIQRLRDLIVRVVGSWVGLLNLISFIALFLAIVSVMAGLLFREVVNSEGANAPDMSFKDFYISYLGMYQIFSGENWTDILYNVMGAELPYGQAIIAVVFLIAFYSFANFVLVNMLIAIIMENFDGAVEKAKHQQQILDFAEKKTEYTKEERRTYVNYLTKYLKPHKTIGIDITQSGWKYKARRGLARQFLLGDKELFHGAEEDLMMLHSNRYYRREPTMKNDQGFSPMDQGENHDEKGGHTSLFIFSPRNKFRQFLQLFVAPAHKKRKEGVPEDARFSGPFNLFITLAILASVIVAAITTPAWRLAQSRKDPDDRSIAIHISDIVFPTIFTIEFLIRVIADGFFFTPDAYLKSLWNQIDFIVLLSLYVPLITNINSSQGYSRFFRSLKSLRALRLINQSAYIKDTFHAVLVAGFPQLINAAMLSVSLIVPFAIYGMRLFTGKFFSCNDNGDGVTYNITTIYECAGTYSSTIGDISFPVPRVWANPHVYSFDNFMASFLILFEIVSQEGWIGVMATARNVMGLGLVASTDASRYNAIFFVIFNLAGGYFVTSLFVAIVIENYTKRTGTAFMTANQRRWMDLKKLLGGIKMSKAKTTAPNNAIGAFCFRIASPKRGWFPRLLTLVTVLDGITLMTERVTSSEAADWEEAKNWIFVFLLLFYMVEIFVRVNGLGWTAYTRSRWHLYNGFVSITALVITVARIGGSDWQPLIQTQKLFLTAILFRLVPQINSLNQLFTTMAASISSIASLFGVWLVVFAVYGIMFVEIFGLTAYGPNGGENINFRNIGTAMLLMARMSTGEGWNDVMHDFAVEKPNCIDQPINYLDSDCGSTAWAYTLFISFNIISMYIFTNMFIVVVMHNFSYVYQIAPGFSLINREEIRGFKRVWGSIDTKKTGYIQEKDLTRFLMELRGVFDMRIYKEEHSLAKLQSRLETAKPNAVKLSAKELEKIQAGANRKPLMLNQTSRRSTMDKEGITNEKDTPAIQRRRPDLSYKIHQEYNLPAFNSAISNIDTEEVRRKRRIFNFVYAEAVMSMDHIPGTGGLKSRSRFLPWRRLSQASTSLGGQAPGSEDYEMGKLRPESLDAEVGISFQKMLRILASYKLIEDDSCFSIDEMLRHRQKMDRIHARVNVIYIKSILLKMILRQRFLKHYHTIEKIRARTDDPSRDAEFPPGDPTEPAYAGIVPSRQIPVITHSIHSFDATSQAADSSQRRVRINTGEPEIAPAAAGSSSSSKNVVAGDKEEIIDSEEAGEMIEGLRSEWRTFINNHDLSMAGMIQNQPMDVDEDEVLGRE
ncbi:calcium channel protein [Mortierella sp. AD094]|nr:calcium channel protein [Mortierella sp. AD094]